MANARHAGTITVRSPVDPDVTGDVPMWTYWSLQEGTLGVDPQSQKTNDGKMPPVIHVDPMRRFIRIATAR